LRDLGCEVVQGDLGDPAFLERQVNCIEQPIEEVRRYSPEMATMFEYIVQKGIEADVLMCRKLYPLLITFDMWVHKTGWAKLAAKRRAEQFSPALLVGQAASLSKKQG